MAKVKVRIKFDFELNETPSIEEAKELILGIMENAVADEELLTSDEYDVSIKIEEDEQEKE